VPVLPLPTPLDQLGPRPFSFYPPIVNIEHNQWIFRRATWSEIQVINVKTSKELWVPRRFLGQVSRIEEPVIVVGLVKELEYKAGVLLPHVRRVIEMPRAVNDLPRRPAAVARPALVVGIRLESSAKSRAGRLVRGAIAAGILVCVTVIIVFRDGPMGSRVLYSTQAQRDLPLTAEDDYFSIVNKFGPPADDRWQLDSRQVHYRRLWYPQQSLALILTGIGHNDEHYAGALDQHGRVIHSVDLPGGQNSRAILETLEK